MVLLRKPAYRAVSALIEQRRDTKGADTHFVKPLPSSLTTIQQAGRRLSSTSNFLTYSKRLLAMFEVLRQRHHKTMLRKADNRPHIACSQRTLRSALRSALLAMR